MDAMDRCYKLAKLLRRARRLRRVHREEDLLCRAAAAAADGLCSSPEGWIVSSLDKGLVDYTATAAAAATHLNHSGPPQQR